MAEYNDVIKQFKRMCWYYSRDKGQKSCPICMSYPNCNIGQCRKIAFEQPACFKDVVMAWAAEHPEPVYPTWKEWLEEQRVVVHFDSVSEKGTKVKWELTNKSNCRIPADIAQLLGIEPKEG